MSIIKLEHADLMKHNTTLLVEIIYNNFKDLADTQELNHTKDAISKNLKSENAFLLLYLDNNQKIGGYLLAEILDLQDGRKVMFISYIFT